jgi:hypothetical protein
MAAEKKKEKKLEEIFDPVESKEISQQLALTLQKTGLLTKQGTVLNPNVRRLVQSFLPGRPGVLRGERPSYPSEPTFDCQRVTYNGKNCSRSFRYQNNLTGQIQDCTEYCLKNCDKWMTNLIADVPTEVVLRRTSPQAEARTAVRQTVVQLKRPQADKSDLIAVLTLVYDNTLQQWFVHEGSAWTLYSSLEKGYVHNLGEDAKTLESMYSKLRYAKKSIHEIQDELHTFCKEWKQTTGVVLRGDTMIDIHIFIRRPPTFSSASTTPASKLTVARFLPHDRYYQPNSKWNIRSVSYQEQDRRLVGYGQMEHSPHFLELRLRHGTNNNFQSFYLTQEERIFR